MEYFRLFQRIRFKMKRWLLISVMALSIQSCTMVKIAISEKRNPTPQNYSFGGAVITTWGAIRVNKSDFFPSSFQIIKEETVIYIDPVGIDSPKKADYILLTHSHPDHFSAKDIGKLVKPETVIVCPEGMLKKLTRYKHQLHVVKPKDRLKFEHILLEATPAYNTKSVFLWIKAHPRSKGNVGFVVTLDNDLRLYHTGDTDYIPEMQDLRDIDVAMVPVGGDNLTMNIAEAAKMVNEIGPKLVLPMHYEIGKKGNLSLFENLVKEGIEVVALD